MVFGIPLTLACPIAMFAIACLMGFIHFRAPAPSPIVTGETAGPAWQPPKELPRAVPPLIAAEWALSTVWALALHLHWLLVIGGPIAATFVIVIIIGLIVDPA